MGDSSYLGQVHEESDMVSIQQGEFAFTSEILDDNPHQHQSITQWTRQPHHPSRVDRSLKRNVGGVLLVVFFLLRYKHRAVT